MNCVHCGKTLKPTATFCSGCGQTVAQAKTSKKFCKQCGKTLKDTATFCSGCGNTVSPSKVRTVSQNNGNTAPQAVKNTKFCKTCGKALKLTATFCSGCGAVVTASVPRTAKPPIRINKKKLTAVASVAVILFGLGVGGSMLWNFLFAPDLPHITFNTSAFELIATNGETQEEIFLATARVDTLSGTVPGDYDVLSMSVRVMVGYLEVFHDEIDPALEWTFNRPPLLPTHNTIIVSALLSSGNTIEGTLFLISPDANHFDMSTLDWGDDDGDGLYNWQEIAIGTDSNNPDTDGDGLTDWEEIFITFTNPLMYDTFGLGMSDADADFDGDGISNIDEIRIHGTDPWNSDTDGDGLRDYEEIFIFRTNPLLYDTDGDGASDGWEVLNGFNPLVFDSNFTFTTTVREPCDLIPVTASATMTLAGGRVETLSVTPVTAADNFLLAPTIPGFMGHAHSFSVDGAFNSAQITFYYDTSLGTIGADFQPRIFYFDEANGFIELPNQTVENGRVSATVNHFSTFILLNSIAFNVVWEVEIRPPALSGATHDIWAEGIDLVFVIDESGSMERTGWGLTPNDPDRIRVSAALEFANALTASDRAAVIGFAANARLMQNLTANMDDVRTQINNIRGDISGTANHAGLIAALNEFDRNGRPGVRRIIILLTDGEDNVRPPAGGYDAILARAREMGVTIYTIGLGHSLDERLLVNIAHSTGGIYFHASEAIDVYLGFEVIQGDFDIDIITDSNGDGIPDFYAQLIYEGKLRLMNGSAELMGTDFRLNPDMDGDGLLNGQEIEIVYANGRVFVRMLSHPLLPDSDFDGIPDAVDAMPLRPNFFPNHTADIDFLMANENFQYSLFVEGHNPGFWNILGDGIVMYLSRINLQNVYTMQMAEFFASNISEDYFEHLMTLLTREEMIRDTWTTINDLIEGMQNGSITPSDGGYRIRMLLATLSESVEESRTNGMDAFQPIAELNVTEWRLHGSTERNIIKTLGYVMSDVVPFLGRLPFQEASNLSDQIGGFYFALSGVLSVIDLAADSARLWQMRSALINDRATMMVVTENLDVLTELRRAAPRNETRRAAQFMIDSTTGSVVSTLEHQMNMIAQQGLYTAVDILILGGSKLFPPLKAITLGLNILNTALGWGDRLEARHEIFVIHDMTNATVRMVGRVYFRSESALNRHLANLVNLRMLGEYRFDTLSRDAASRRAASANRDNVRHRASQMGLPLFE